MSDAIVTIYMPMLNEGTDAWRPVKAMRQREDIYCVMGPVPDGEEWKFPPGTMVRRKPRTMSGGKTEMVAVPA